MEPLLAPSQTGKSSHIIRQEKLSRPLIFDHAVGIISVIRCRVRGDAARVPATLETVQMRDPKIADSVHLETQESSLFGIEGQAVDTITREMVSNPMEGIRQTRKVRRTSYHKVICACGISRSEFSIGDMWSNWMNSGSFIFSAFGCRSSAMIVLQAWKDNFKYRIRPALY